MRMAIWGLEVRYFFPRLDYLVLLNEHPLYLPYDKVNLVNGVSVKYLDEIQFVIEPIPDDQWDEVVDAARPYLVDPFDRPQGQGTNLINRPPQTAIGTA